MGALGEVVGIMHAEARAPVDRASMAAATMVEAEEQGALILAVLQGVWERTIA